MDMRNNKRHSTLTHTRVNFSQSQDFASAWGGGGGGLKIVVTTGGGELTEKIQKLLALIF